MWNFECSTVVSVTPLLLVKKDKVEELSNLGLKLCAVGAGEEEVFAEGATSVGASFGVCCPGETSNFLFLKR